MGMKGRTTKQVRAIMQKTFTQIKAQYPQAELIDTIISEVPPVDNNIAMWYLGKSIELLAGADMVFFVDDYHLYRGCTIERRIAMDYGKLCADFKTK